MRLEIKPSYYATIAPRSNSNKSLNMGSSSAVILEATGDSISNSAYFPCSSHIDSKVIRCNNRLLVAAKSDVGRKVWNSISRLGVTYEGDDNISINMLERMELRDQKGLKVAITITP